MAIHSGQVVEAIGKNQSSQYLNCIESQYQEKERKSGVFGYEHIVQGVS